MGDSEVQQTANWRLEDWFPKIDKKTHSRLKILFDELITANRTISLISPKTVPFADVIHFADCILALEAIREDDKTCSEIYDFGTGNGFPGLIGAVLFPEIKFVIVNVDDKKNEYIARCVASLGLNNIESRNASVESLTANSVSCAVARGSGNISKIILAARKCFGKGGNLYHMKSENWAMEVGDIPTQLCSVWSPALVKEYRLPVGEMRFAVVKTEKIA